MLIHAAELLDYVTKGVTHKNTVGVTLNGQDMVVAVHFINSKTREGKVIDRSFTRSEMISACDDENKVDSFVFEVNHLIREEYKHD